MGSPKYYIYDLMAPHCSRARAYRQIGGKIRYRCRHELKS